MNTHTNPYVLTRPRVTTRLAALGVATLAAIGLSLGNGSPALAHDVLVGTSPVGSAESGDAPGLQLDFNNEVMNIGTEMIGVDEAGNSVLEGEPIVSGRSVTQHLVEGLADGDYEVAWNVVSSDGHPIQGIVAVTIVAGYPTEVVPAGAADDHDHDHEGEHDHDHADESAAPGVPTQDDSQATNGRGSNFALFGWVALFVILGGTAAYLAVSAKKRRAAGAGSGSGTESDSSAESGSSDEPRDTEAGSSDSGANTESAN